MTPKSPQLAKTVAPTGGYRVECLCEKVINLFTSAGEYIEPLDSGAVMPDEDDRVFYEVTLSKDGAKLVTGNAKHFPKSERVVTPVEFLEILKFQA